MTDKVPIELTPYTALEILSFIEEFKKDFEGRENCGAILKTFKEYSDEVYLKITDQQLEDAIKERQINRALGYIPN